MSGFELVDRIAAHGLLGAVDPTNTIEISDSDSDEVVALVEKNRISGIAVAALAEQAMVASDDVSEKFVLLHDQVMAQTMRVEIMAVRTSGLLTDSGIDHRVLKGPALAHTIYADPAERSFRDVDILVQSKDIDRVVSLLMSEGATRGQSELRQGFDRRFAKSVTLKLDGVEIDIHRVLSPGPFGVWLKPNDLFVLRDVVEIAGVDVPILDRTDALLHACYHVALGQVEPALSNVRDIALLAGPPGDVGYDVGRFDLSVDRWRGRAVIARAVRLVEHRFGNVLPASLARFESIKVSPEENEALEPYLTEGDEGRFGALVPATLRALPLADRAAYALAVGLPEGTEPVGRLKELINRRS